MKGLLEFLSHFYWLSVPETVAETFWHADWRGAYRRDGLFGLIAEAGHSLLGTNSWPFFVPIDSQWSGRDIEELLGGYGIEMWGQNLHNGELFFRVRKEKAAWAQYLMLQSGIQLQHRLLAEKARSPRPQKPMSDNSMGQSLAGFVDNTEHELDSAIDEIASTFGL